MKKIWFILCMCFVMSLGLNSCSVNEATQSKIDASLERQVVLTAKLKDAYKQHKEGKLTTEALLTLKDDITENITETKKELEELKASGVGWVELVTAVVIGVASRGIPSKGLLSSMFGMMTARREDDPKKVKG